MGTATGKIDDCERRLRKVGGELAVESRPIGIPQARVRVT